MSRAQIIYGMIMLICMSSMLGMYYNESRLLRRKYVMVMYLSLAVVEAILSVLSFAGVIV